MVGARAEEAEQGALFAILHRAGFGVSETVGDDVLGLTEEQHQDGDVVGGAAFFRRGHQLLRRLKAISVVSRQVLQDVVHHLDRLDGIEEPIAGKEDVIFHPCQLKGCAVRAAGDVRFLQEIPYKKKKKNKKLEINTDSSRFV